MSQPLKDLIKSTALLERLEKAGYNTRSDIKEGNILQITQDTELTEEEIATLLPLMDIDSQDTITATDLIEEHRIGISTSCERLNQLFAPISGIPRSSITELSGPPGTGKTQICLQLACNVQLPTSEGGLDGECIYIDTEGGLMLDRLQQIAQINEVGSQHKYDLKKIHYFRVLDHYQFIALLRQLPDALQQLPNVKLLIVDSIIYHFRLNIRDNRTRTGLLNFIGQSLMKLANEFKLAVIATNHASTDRMYSLWRPALGDFWSQWCTHRLLLSRTRQQRYASIYGVTHSPLTIMAPFLITESGISDEDEEMLTRWDQWQQTVLQTKRDDLSALQEEQPQQQHAESVITHHEDEFEIEGNEDDLWLAMFGDHDHWEQQKEKSNESLDNNDASLGCGEEKEEEGGWEDDREQDILAPDSQPDLDYTEATIDDLLSVDLPTATLRRPSSSPISSKYKRRRHSIDSTNEKNNTSNVNIQHDDQDYDDWAFENEDFWIQLIGKTSPGS